MSRIGWTPIYVPEKSIIEGKRPNGEPAKIINLSISNYDSFTGFASVSAGTIKNLIFEEVDVHLETTCPKESRYGTLYPTVGVVAGINNGTIEKKM